MDEKNLVRRILHGDERAISNFYHTYKKKIQIYIDKKINSKKDAEEVLQDTLISAFDSMPLFQFNCSLLSWLKVIAHHEVVDFYRKKKIKTLIFSHFPLLERLVDQALGPELALQEKEAKIKIWLTLKHLSEGYRKVLRLKYIDGLTMAEIAEELKITVKAVESRLFRARLAFQKEFVQNKKLNKRDWQILLTAFDKRELSF